MFYNHCIYVKKILSLLSNFGSNESYSYSFPVSLVSRELTQIKEKHASEVSQMKDVIKKTSSSTATQYEKMVGKFENIGISCSDKIDCSASNIFVVIFFQRVYYLQFSGSEIFQNVSTSEGCLVVKILFNEILRTRY